MGKSYKITGKPLTLVLPTGYSTAASKLNPSTEAHILKGSVYVGTVWTFRNDRWTVNPWHAKRSDGTHKAFYKADGGKRAAVEFVTMAAANV